MKKLLKKPFVRNVAMVMTGTGTAQLIAIAVSPFLTRLYGPDNLGVLGVYFSAIAILVPLVALTYPYAIVLPEREDEARSLAALSLIIIVAFTSVLSLVLYIYAEPVLSFSGMPEVIPYWYMLPIGVAGTGIYQIAQHAVIRQKLFTLKSRALIAAACIVNGLKVGLGFVFPSALTLIVASALEKPFQAVLLHRKGAVSGTVTWHTIRQAAVKFKDFPLYRAPQMTINSASKGLPTILLAVLVSPAAAGFYAIGRKVMELPLNVIGNSITSVMYPRLNDAMNNNEPVFTYLAKSSVVLFLLGLPAFGLVIAFGPQLFGFVFGSEWVVAGSYARWLSLWLWMSFVCRPSSAAIPVFRMQGFLLVFQIIGTTAGIAGLVGGYFWFGNDLAAIIVYSIITLVWYIMLVAIVFVRAWSVQSARSTAIDR